MFIFEIDYFASFPAEVRHEFTAFRQHCFMPNRAKDPYEFVVPRPLSCHIRVSMKTLPWPLVQGYILLRSDLFGQHRRHGFSASPCLQIVSTPLPEVNGARVVFAQSLA
jgi:hypothetical protein